MSKRIQAKHKLDRRMGQNIWGRPKSPVNRREYGPGQHGQRRKGKMSDFGTQLRAKQKLKGYYANITEKQFRRYYAEAIDKVYGEIAPTAENVLGLIHKEPLGVVGVIVPWNFPLMIGAWKIAPALAAGNCVVVKPPEIASLTLLRLAELGVRLPTLQDGRRLLAAALRVPNVMPATVVLRSDGSVAEVLPRSFANADEIAAAVDPKIGVSG